MNHSFDIAIAEKYGVNAAILLQHIFWWCEKNKANETNYYDGLYWTYNSRKAFTMLFPYMSEKQIRTALDRLVNEGLIVIGNYNEDKRDRTLWYAATEKGSCICQKGCSCSAKKANEDAHEGRPLPDINTDINTDNIIYNNDDENTCARACDGDTPETAPNAYGDEIYEPTQTRIEQYATDNLRYMGERAMQELVSFLEDLPEPVVRHGIDNALDNDKRTWSYVRAILNSYVEEGVKTVQEAVDVDKKHSQRYAQKEKPKTVMPIGKKTAEEESADFWGRVKTY